MRKIRKLFNIGFGVAVVSGVAYYVFNFATAESRVREACHQIKTGMEIEQLWRFVNARGLSPKPKASGVSIVSETKTFGRYGCKVVTEAGVVKGATYNYAD